MVVPFFPDSPPLSKEEIAIRKAEDDAFEQRYEAIFAQIAPALMTEHYGWSFILEPGSGDYFIYPEPEVCF